MQYTINELYDYLHQKLNTIHDIFNGFFGEDYVDMQEDLSKDTILEKIAYNLELSGIKVYYAKDMYDVKYEITDEILDKLKDITSCNKVYIYVWFPGVTVANEYDRSVNIQDLYAQVAIQYDGSIPYEYYGFKLNRATYTQEQFLSNYMHSHVCDIPKHDFTAFQSPCLGTGPIRGTIATLKNDYDEATWMLFCQELSMYVTVESIQGGPYHRMEHIGTRNILSKYTKYDFSLAGLQPFLYVFNKEILKGFIRYYIKNGHLSISYRNGKFTYGMSFYEYIIDVSNAFIDYYNKYLGDEDTLELCEEQKLIVQALVSNGKFYSQVDQDDSTLTIDRYQGKPVLLFKGKVIKTNIMKEEESEASWVTLLNISTAMYILKNILRTINFRYKNEHNNTTRNKETASTCQRVCYL